MPAHASTGPRADARQLVSVGYEGRTAGELIESLRQQGVQVLVDVRLTPLSRKKGLSKRGLAEALDEVGIRYVHHRQLGNPRDNRDDFRQGSAESRERYRRLLTTGPAEDALKHVSELMDEGLVALLCFERDHAQCHRRLIVDVLAQRQDLVLVHA